MVIICKIRIHKKISTLTFEWYISSIHIKYFKMVYLKTILEVMKENEKLKKEKDVLMAVAAGNWKRGDEFKEICKEYFTEEYIQICVGDKDSTLVGEYFQDTEEEDNRITKNFLP